MKKTYIILVLLFLVMSVYSQKTYKLLFDKEDFIYDKNPVLTIIPQNLSYSFSRDTKTPALPYTTFNILLPENGKVVDFKVEVQKELLYTDIDIRSCPEVILANSSTLQSKSSLANPIYPEKIYPKQQISFITEHQWKGYTFGGFVACPFIYDTVEKNLYFISEMTITLQIEKQVMKNTFSIKKEEAKKDLKDLVINPEELEKEYPSLRFVSATNNLSDIEYLIVTTDELKDAFKPLLAWKIQKGVSTKIITLSEIYSNSVYNAATNQEKIKKCLQDYYSNHNLKWVLLGGDDTVIPIQLCRVIVRGHNDPNDPNNIRENIPSDLFYACFDKAFNWDQNGNGIVGELGDNVDYYPEINIARIPIRSVEHVKAFLKKLFVYEKSPAISNYVEKMLLAGSKLYVYYNNHSESDVHYRSEAMYDRYIAPYWNGKKYRFYDTGTDFASGNGASYDFNTSNLQDQLNNGYHFININTHGSVSAWSMEDGSSYSSANALNLHNNNTSIIATTACNTNAFDSSIDPCLSEALIRNPNGGCIAYWGGTRYGWTTQDTTVYIDQSLKYSANFFNYIFTGKPASDPYKLAALTSAYIKQRANNLVYIDDIERWLLYSMNLMGDPEMSIHTQNPLTFTSVTMTGNGTTLTVNTGGVSDCTIAVTSMDYGVSYFNVAKNVSSYTFTNVPELYCVTITKHNYIPYIYTHDIYIQNIVLDRDYYIQADNIYVGNNVTTSKPQGNVVITNNAHVIFDAVENVHFAPGFECNPGATYEIKK